MSFFYDGRFGLIYTLIFFFFSRTCPSMYSIMCKSRTVLVREKTIRRCLFTVVTYKFIYFPDHIHVILLSTFKLHVTNGMQSLARTMFQHFIVFSVHKIKYRGNNRAAKYPVTHEPRNKFVKKTKNFLKFPVTSNFTAHT